MLKNASDDFSSSRLNGLTKLTLGAAGGAGLPKNRDNGSTLYPACTFLTFSMSPQAPHKTPKSQAARHR